MAKLLVRNIRIGNSVLLCSSTAHQFDKRLLHQLGSAALPAGSWAAERTLRWAQITVDMHRSGHPHESSRGRKYVAQSP